MTLAENESGLVFLIPQVENRLKSEFKNANGGIYSIEELGALALTQPAPKGFLKILGIMSSEKNRITFLSRKSYHCMCYPQP